MKKRFFYLSLIILITGISIITADNFGYTNRDVPGLSPGINYSIINVSQAEYWKTDEGILDNVADISLNYLGDLQFTSNNFNGSGNFVTSGSGTFGEVDVDTLNLNGNVISDSTGTISFDDEILTAKKIQLSSTSTQLQLINGIKSVYFTLYSGGVMEIDGSGYTQLQDQTIIDITHTEAFLIRKNSEGGNVLVVDTTNSKVGIGTLNFSSGLIVDNSGAISFGDENLTTTGNITAEYYCVGTDCYNLTLYNNTVWTSTFNSTYDTFAHNQTIGATAIGQATFLNLSGTNANQDINISPYNLELKNLSGADALFVLSDNSNPVYIPFKVDGTTNPVTYPSSLDSPVRFAFSNIVLGNYVSQVVPPFMVGLSVVQENKVNVSGKAKPLKLFAERVSSFYRGNFTSSTGGPGSQGALTNWGVEYDVRLANADFSALTDKNIPIIQYGADFGSSISQTSFNAITDDITVDIIGGIFRTSNWGGSYTITEDVGAVDFDFIGGEFIGDEGSPTGDDADINTFGGRFSAVGGDISYGIYIGESSGTTPYGIWDASGEDWVLDADNQKIFIGEGQDVSYTFNGSDVIVTAEVGSPNVFYVGFPEFNIDGNLNVEGNLTYDAIYIQASSLLDQEFGTANVIQPINLTTTDESNGISISISNVSIPTAGVYSIFAQPQVTASAGQSGVFHMWLEKHDISNWVNVSNSNVELSLGSQEEDVIPLIVTIKLNAGEKVRVMGSVSNTGISLDAQVLLTEPTIPSIIFTMYKIGS